MNAQDSIANPSYGQSEVKSAKPSWQTPDAEELPIGLNTASKYQTVTEYTSTTGPNGS